MTAWRTLAWWLSPLCWGSPVSWTPAGFSSTSSSSFAASAHQGMLSGCLYFSPHHFFSFFFPNSSPISIGYPVAINVLPPPPSFQHTSYPAVSSSDDDPGGARRVHRHLMRVMDTWLNLRGEDFAAAAVGGDLADLWDLFLRKVLPCTTRGWVSCVAVVCSVLFDDRLPNARLSLHQW